MKTLYKSTLINSKFITIVLICLNMSCYSQKQKKTIKTYNVINYGAIPNDDINDQFAFEQICNEINARGGNAEIIIPSGTYIVGRQTDDDKNYFRVGIQPIHLRNVSNVTIKGIGKPKLLQDVGMYYGTFNPENKKSTNYNWVTSHPMIIKQRATLCIFVQFTDCNNMTLDNVILDGGLYPERLNNMNTFDLPGGCQGIMKSSNFSTKHINLGGGYGQSINLAHYGVMVLHSGNVTIKNSSMIWFGMDGIAISNHHKINKHDNVEIVNCEIDYNGRTGISLSGGKNINIVNNKIMRTGHCLIFSTTAGIDIEAEPDYKYSDKLIQNLNIERNYFYQNKGGEILSRFGKGSSNVTIADNEFVTWFAALNLNTRDTNYTIQGNVFQGRKLMVVDNKQIKIDNKNEISNKRIKGINFKENDN